MKKFMMVIGAALAAILLTFGLFGCTKAQKLKMIDFPLTDEDYAFAVQKGNADLMTAANELIAELNANGKLGQLITKYSGEDESDFVKYSNPTNNPDTATQLVVATNAEFTPFEFKLGNFYTGIDIEVAKMLAEKVGKPLYIADMAFDAVVLSVSGTTTAPKDQPDLIIPTVAQIGMAGLTITEDRKKVVNFTNSYFHSSQYVIVMDSDTTFDTCKSVEDVKKILKEFNDSVKIGYQNGTTGQFFTEDLHVTRTGFTNGTLAGKDLQYGRIKCVIIDKLPANAIVQKLNALVG